MPKKKKKNKKLTYEQYESEVRFKLLHNMYRPHEIKYALSWLDQYERRLERERLDRSESREAETLSISRKALLNSKRATTIATSAIILSIIMAIYEFTNTPQKIKPDAIPSCSKEPLPKLRVDNES